MTEKTCPSCNGTNVAEIMYGYPSSQFLDEMKKDENKTQQLLLYKQFYSKQYNHPIDKIEVEYFIVKRKLWENAMFPQKRVQKFSPASGTVSMNKVAKGLDTFLDLAFDENGEQVSENITATPSKKACRWCEFKKTEHCSVGVG